MIAVKYRKDAAFIYQEVTGINKFTERRLKIKIFDAKAVSLENALIEFFYSVHILRDVEQF